MARSAAAISRSGSRAPAGATATPMLAVTGTAPAGGYRRCGPLSAALGARAGDDHHELVPAVAADRIVGPHRRAHTR